MMTERQLTIRPNLKVNFTIVHEDRGFLIVDKPAGVVTQPGAKHRYDTLLNGLFAHDGYVFQNLGKVRDFGLIHRLDRPTSGLLVVGREGAAYDHIRQQFKMRTVQKTYLAIVHGHLPDGRLTVSTPIKEVRMRGRKRAVLGQGRGAQAARTEIETVARSKTNALVVCRPKTGRLHQIRVHLAHRGCPIVGDFDYGRRLPLDRGVPRDMIALHAAELGFTHPDTGAHIEFRTPLPSPFIDLLKRVGLTCPRRWRTS
ncbi:MAG: RluA family pseudouridine synthase [Myxococcota bacterium]|nr:RluA family pseudouridine synthase [Myxococcota bacterium]